MVRRFSYNGACGRVETLEWEVGLKQSNMSELEKSLLVKVGAKMTYAATEGLGGEVSFAREEGEKWTRRTEVERYENVKGHHSVSYDDGQRVPLVVWALVSQYMLQRANGDVVGEVEFVENDDIAREYSERA
jgi:hypothetical protein